MSVERKVLVGRIYSEMSNTWTEWSDDSFDAVVAKMTERRKDGKVNDKPDEIIEVVVVRKVRLKGTVIPVEVSVPGFVMGEP